MDGNKSLVSVLVTTYNRIDLLKRNLTKIRGQSYSHLEIIVVDDCSSDETESYMRQVALEDRRINYIRNQENVAKVYGDRAHMHAFLKEYSTGDYIVWICDDDYWVSNELIKDQVEFLDENSDAVMIIGSQLSCFGDGANEIPVVSDENLSDIMDNYQSTNSLPRYEFFNKVHEKSKMTSPEFLESFCRDPMRCNIICGAMLYRKSFFLESGAISSTEGSRWQAGYEMIVGPGHFGSVGYINYPCIVVDVRAANASFGGTQYEHYKDSLKSVELAHENAWKSHKMSVSMEYSIKTREKLVRKISQTFLRNSCTYLETGELTLCTEENVSRLVGVKDILKQYWKYRIIPHGRDLVLSIKFMLLSLRKSKQ